MKKILVLLLMLCVAGCVSVFADAGTISKKETRAIAKEQARVEKQRQKAQKELKRVEKEAKKQAKANKDVLKDEEYKIIKRDFFNAEGYGDTYNCKVDQQRFCKVKDLDTGVYVLCDREVSRTQMESAKVFFKLGRCTKLN